MRRSAALNRLPSPGGDEAVRVRKHRPDVQIVLYMGLLMMLGLIVMFAIGPQRANVLNAVFDTDHYTGTYFFTRQFLYVIIAVAAFIFTSSIPYRLIIRYQRTILFIGLGACLLLALASMAGLGIAEETLGASRWFYFGPISFQPSEVLKFGVLIYAAMFLGAQKRAGQVNSWQETILPLGLVVAVSEFFVVVVQRDLGTGVSLLAIVLTMLMVAQVSWRNLGIIAGVVALFGILFIVTSQHRMERVATFFKGDQTSVSDGGSYHIEHAKIAIGTGGLFGVGIGNSIQATGYLPEAINDSIFAIMGETFGFVGLVATIALFAALLARLLRAMDGLVDYRLKLLVAGVFGWFGSHIVLNIGAMIGVVPLTGITLPLLSFGGTSMLFVAAALGVVFQLSRYTTYESKLKEKDYEGSRSRRGVGRSRYTSRRST